MSREKQSDKQQQMSMKEKCRIFAKALGISLKTKKPYSLIVSLLGFPMALIPALVSKTLGTFTNEVQDFAMGQGRMGDPIRWIVLMILLYLLQEIYLVAESYCREQDIISVNCFIEETVMDCSVDVEYKYIENEADFRKRLTFVEQWGARRVSESMNLVLKLIHHLITFISVSVSLFAVDWKVVFVLFLANIPAVWIAGAQNDSNYRYQLREMDEAMMATRLYQMACGIGSQSKALHTVRFTGAYPWLKKRWRQQADHYIGIKKELSRKFLWRNLIADLLRNGVFVFALLLTAYKIYQNPSLGLGIFMSVYLLSKQFQNATGKLFIGGARLSGDVQYMKDFFALEEISREPKEKEMVSFEDATIVCENVSFTYPNADKEALKDVTVTIRQGEKIAIVGHNGSGKSTFVNLLCGMYEPTKGSVKIGGRNVYDYLTSIRRAISVVFQNFGKYETTLRENITIGDNTRIADDNEIMELAKLTGADVIINQQPRGLSEEVGTFSDTGNNLSGGQWQKMALTRALFRKKSRIIILDEPTAALDPIAEAELYRDFTALTGDKTTLLISHRLGIASVVDRILVFDGGRIVEDGSHESLMQKDGVYAKLYRAQAEWYQ